MSNSLPSVPYPSNEPIKSYAPGSVEKKEVLSEAEKIYDVEKVIPSIYLATELSRSKI